MLETLFGCDKINVFNGMFVILLQIETKFNNG